MASILLANKAGLLLTLVICYSTGQDARTSNSVGQGCKKLTDNVHVCRGSWHGHVSNATDICRRGFHICSWRDRQLLRELTVQNVLSILTDYRDCYAINAAQNYGCRECTGVESANKMAGLGGYCQHQFLNTGPESSCLGSGMIHHDDGEGRGRIPCTFQPGRTTGVVCCREETTEPPATYKGPIPPGYEIPLETQNALFQRSSPPPPMPPTTKPLRVVKPKMYYGGCHHKNRTGLFHLKYVAPCRGIWSGHVKSARRRVCASGWKVCNLKHQWMLADITFNISNWGDHALPGCYALNMAHNLRGECVACRNSFPPTLMAGVGADCSRKHPHHKVHSCFGTGRIDALRPTLQNAHKCTHHGLLDGVLCCKKKVIRPCSQLNDCSGNGHCDTSVNETGMCVCELGRTGKDCSQAICTRRCKNGGTCLGPNFCKCAPGWKGRTCGVPVCKERCNPRGGVCYRPNKCRCFRNFIGSKCQITADKS